MQREEKRCWQILSETAQSVGYSIETKFRDETIKLHLLADLMLLEDNLTVDGAAHLHLDTLQATSIFSRIDILYPNNVLVSSDGTQRIFSDGNSIETIVSYGDHLTGRKIDAMTGKECVYYSVPVVRDGEAMAILIGVISAESLSHTFHMTIYDGQANICIIDSSNGDFIMDNWHDTLGNAYDMQDRKRLEMYEDVDLKKEIQNRETGVIAFVSQTTGHPIYMYFIPINVFDWQLLIFAQEDVLFENLIYIKNKLICEKIVEVFLLAVYFYWNFYNVYQLEKRNTEIQQQREQLRQISYRDLLTSLYNRNKYEEVLEELQQRTPLQIGIVYIDLNDLKHLNDTQSHTAGDRYICDAAKAITETF